MNKNIFIGIIAGFFSGFFGSGGGLILLPFFTNILKCDDVKSRVTTIFCILFMTITSTILYLKNNFIDWDLAIRCMIGGGIGSIIGSKILIKTNEVYLKIFYIGFLIYTGIKIIL